MNLQEQIANLTGTLGTIDTGLAEIKARYDEEAKALKDSRKRVIRALSALQGGVDAVDAQ